MLKVTELLKFIEELNDEIENDIDNLSIIEKINIETDGNFSHIKLGDSLYWTDEEEEINSKEDLEQILLERLKHHKTQVDGMIQMYERNKVKSND